MNILLYYFIFLIAKVSLKTKENPLSENIWNINVMACLRPLSSQRAISKRLSNENIIYTLVKMYVNVMTSINYKVKQNTKKTKTNIILNI